jgi:Rieske 2Fe-2S family protein
MSTPSRAYGTYSASDLEALIRTRQPMRPLPRDFYVSADVFAADMDRIFSRTWLFAGYACWVPNPGDWFTYALGHDSIVFVRDERSKLRAYHNTCRHRGSAICRSEFGKSTRFVCPYHQWTYGLDGRLMMNTEEEFGVDRAKLSLHPVAMRDVEGLIFFCLADDPPSFDAAAKDIGTRLRPHGFDRAKTAKAISYDVKANWKLVFENNRECYHCPANHPDYTRATYDVGRTDPRRSAEIRKLTEKANARFARLGLDTGDEFSNMTGAYWRANRTPMADGWVTQSLDGRPVAPLMGDLKENDAGTVRNIVYPNFWQHASDDHAVGTRITPVGPDLCKVDVYWLVHKDAVEGRDYTLDRLLPFWKDVSEQDWQICEDNQKGVRSSRYEPGPYSNIKETNVAHFVDWYLDELKGPKVPRKAANA